MSILHLDSPVVNTLLQSFSPSQFDISSLKDILLHNRSITVRPKKFNINIILFHIWSIINFSNCFRNVLYRFSPFPNPGSCHGPMHCIWLSYFLSLFQSSIPLSQNGLLKFIYFWFFMTLTILTQSVFKCS